jgi:uncharacterized membrane protein
MIFVSDLDAAMGSKSEGQRVLTEFEHFKGLIFDADNPGDTYINLFVLSASSFLGLSNSVSLIGPAQTVIILERFLGLVLPLMVVVLIFQHHTKVKRDGQETLFIYLNRGWQILKVKYSKTLKLQEVELVSPNADRMTEVLFVSSNSEVDDAIKHFKIKWRSADLSLVPFFMKMISDELRGEDNELAFQALEYSYISGDIKDERYVNLYFFLKEIKGSMSMIKSNVSYSDIECVLRIIEKQNPTVTDEILSKKQLEVSDDE